MGTLTLPQARIPIGWAMFNGQRVPVEINIEWNRSLITLVERAGGVTGSSTTELSASAFEDAGIEETKASLYSFNDSLWQAPPASLEDRVEELSTEVAELRAKVAELTKDFEGARMGVFA